MRELWIFSYLQGNKVSNFRKRRREIETVSQNEFTFPTKSHFKKKTLSKQKDRNQNQNKRKWGRCSIYNFSYCRRSGRRWKNGNFMSVQLYWDIAVQSLWRYSGEEMSSQKCTHKPSPKASWETRSAPGGEWRNKVTGFPWKGCQGTAALKGWPSPLALLCHLERSLRSKSQVCFPRACSPPDLAFCKIVCCHGDNHLDNSFEQGLVKWANRTPQNVHFRAGKLPGRNAMSAFGYKLGCYEASQNVLHRFISPCIQNTLVCCFISFLTMCLHQRCFWLPWVSGLPHSIWAPTFSHYIPHNSPLRSSPFLVLHIWSVDHELLPTHHP